MHVCVWKNGREVRGWDGKDVTFNNVIKHPVMDVKTALFSVYKTDAHFCPAVLYENDFPVSVQPRLNKPSLEELEKKGKSVRFKIIAIDVDAPGKNATDEWRNAEKEKVNASAICSNAIVYYTANGYRLLWELEIAKSVPEYESVLTRLRQTLLQDGITADPLIDWTRCYRLPKVMRDGISQDLFLLVPSSFILNEGLLVAQITNPLVAAILGGKVEATTLHVEAVDKGGRNNYLFKVASKMRASGWIEEDMYYPMLKVINETKCNPPLSDKDVKTIAQSVLRYEKGTEDTEEVDSKIKVVLKVGNMAEIVDETIRALATSMAGQIYHRAGKLIRIVEDRIEMLPKPALRKIMADNVEFIRYAKDKDSEEFIEVKQDPPKDIVEMVWDAGTFPGIPELHEIITLPTIREDGSLLNQPGYDSETQTFLQTTVVIESVPTGRKEAEDALHRLLDMIDQFPFEKEHHKATAIAAMMTPIVRSAIRGPCPLFIFDSTTPGTGKSKLADIAAFIASGASAPRMTQTGEEEMEKRITSLLANGSRAVLIDNIEKPLGGPSLDAVLTSDMWAGRLLGTNSMIKLRARAVWFATGNNIIIKGDISRRAVRCHLDAGVEKPEERTNFRITNHQKYIEENRESIVRDILTIALSWHGEETKAKTKNFGSFESWSYWVRESIMWLGMEDPVQSQEELREDSNVGNWAAVLEAISKIFEDKWFSLKDLYDVAFEGVRKNAENDAYNALIANISFFCEPNIKQLAWVLKRWINRVLNDKKLTRGSKDRMKGFLYRVECKSNIDVLQQAA